MVVNRGRTYATSGCAVRMAVRTGRWAEVIARREAKFTPEQKLARLANMHGRQRAEQWEKLMDRWLKLAVEEGQVREAIKAAYRRGYLAGNSRLYRREKKRKKVA